MENQKEPRLTSAEELLDSLFEEKLTNEEEYDPEVVKLVGKHLGKSKPRSKAGAELAQDLVALAKRRAKEASK